MKVVQGNFRADLIFSPTHVRAASYLVAGSATEYRDAVSALSQLSYSSGARFDRAVKANPFSRGWSETLDTDGRSSQLHRTETLNAA